MIVAIDGPAGSGKSTVARTIARDCGLSFLDTGAMYRTVTWACLERGVDLADDQAVSEVATSVAIAFSQAEDGQRVSCDGTDVTEAIRTAEVDRNVSRVSAVVAVREAMVAQQRALAAEGDVIAEGRDIGTVVFPNADVKVFLVASPESRARRRAIQRAGGDAATGVNADVSEADYEQILADIIRRDELDSSRDASPLCAAEDAVTIDTSDLTLSQVLDRVRELVQSAGGER